MDEPPEDARSDSSFSTPKMVGLMAGGILAVVFLAAIVRGIGTGEPAAGGASSPSAGGAPVAAGPLEPGKILLLGPKDAVPREGLTFRWQGGVGFTEYQVTIYDPTMKRIWSSERITGESLVPPGEIMEFLQTGSIYQWSVAAFRPGEDVPRMHSHSFRLVE